MCRKLSGIIAWGRRSGFGSWCSSCCGCFICACIISSVRSQVACRKQACSLVIFSPTVCQEQSRGFCSLSRALYIGRGFWYPFAVDLCCVNWDIRDSGNVKVSIVCPLASLCKRKVPHVLLLHEKKCCWGLGLCYRQGDSSTFPFVLYFEHPWSENLRSQMLCCSCGGQRIACRNQSLSLHFM